MSRIGNKAISIPAGVTVSVDGQRVSVKGPKGNLERELHPAVKLTVEDGSISVARENDERLARGLHGLSRTLVSNMIDGVVKPFEKNLELSGVGYRAELKGDVLTLQVGLSYNVEHRIPKGVDCRVDKQTTVFLSSCDKELVGQVAASIRAYRPCEPYKGKGIKYQGEQVRRKERGGA